MPSLGTLLVCMYVCMFVCMYVCMYVLFMYVFRQEGSLCDKTCVLNMVNICCMYTLTDVSAKENAQETAVTLIGIVGGLAFAR